MASIRNISDEDRYVPLYDTVIEADAVYDIDDDDLDGFTCQPDVWEDASLPSVAATTKRPSRRKVPAPSTTDNTSADAPSEG